MLVVSLIMLALISLLAALSMRNATSSEAISGGVRTTELATQAAEIALRYCEASALASTTAATTATTTPAKDDALTPFVTHKPAPAGSTPRWQNIQAWDSHAATVVVLPLHTVNQAGMANTYRRPPECMIDALPLMTTTIAVFVITARGFGPEVPSKPSHGHPAGAEVWLQSQVESRTESPTRSPVQPHIEQGRPGSVPSHTVPSHTAPPTTPPTTSHPTLRTWRQIFMR